MNLDAIGEILVDLVRESMTDKVYQYGKSGSLTNRVASKKMINSLGYLVQTEESGVQSVGVTSNGEPLSNTYAYFLIYCRNASSQNANWGAIKQWIIDKQIKLRGKNGQFIAINDKNINSAASAISKSIGRFGYKNKPKNFVDITYEKLMGNQEILNLLEGATVDDLLNYIEGL